MWPVLKFAPAILLLVLAAPDPGLCVDLSIPALVAGQGASIPVGISLANPDQPISALQFDLSFDDSVLSLATVIGNATRASGKSAYLAAQAANRTRFIIWQFDRNPISDGTILNLFLNVAPNAAPGVYHIHFEAALAADADGHPVSVSTSDGTLTVEAFHDAAVASQGVLNGASLLPGSIAPGELITIMGSGIGWAAAATSITFNGLPSPLIYASANQVNAVVPFGIAGLSTTTLEIANASGTTTSLSVPVGPSSPGIFTLTGNGAGPGAILNQDSTINSPDNPAARESIIVIYATGGGQTNPSGVDGAFPTTVLPKPLLPVSVQVGGAACAILYAGAAPEIISGVLQVNCRVPAQITPGNAVPVLLTIGEATSPPVTVAIK